MTPVRTPRPDSRFDDPGVAGHGRAISGTAGKRALLGALALPLAFAALCAQAQTTRQLEAQVSAQPAASLPGTGWGLGFAAGYDRMPYRDFDNKVRVLPLVSFESPSIGFFGTTFDIKLPSAGAVAFRLRARYFGDGYEADDSPYLDGMAKRRGGVSLGGAAVWGSQYGNLTVEALGAVGDAEGKRVRLAFERGFQSGAWSLTPRLEMTWLDSDHVDYYYGVRTGEARVGRAAYEGDSTVNVGVGLRLGYALAPNQSVFLDVGGTRLGSGIRDSPLVDRSTQSGVRAGYLYRF
jgi:outer membrane protein